MELKIDRVQVNPNSLTTVYASVHAEDAQQGRTLTGAPEDHTLTSQAVLDAAAALLDAAIAELAANEAKKGAAGVPVAEPVTASVADVKLAP